MPKLYLLICFLLFCTGVLAQKPAEKSVPLVFEKAYLHTDRDVYGQNEDIWFKAYIANAQNNTPISYSHNLYVELISPASKIIKRETIRLENGLGNGDFKLADTIPAGQYRLRAYTNWMRNFGDNFIFEKNIRIIRDVLSEPGAMAATRKKPVEQLPLPKINPDTLPLVRFFPEGGSMVNGLSSVIAVKAEDSNGRGISTAGRIFNSAGETVTDFTCDSLGFGAFALLPDAAQHYQASVSISHQDRLFDLPQVSATGFNLHVQVKQQAIMIAIRCDEVSFNEKKDRQIYLAISHGGKTRIRKVLELNTRDLLVNLNDDLLPDGISSVTISDTQNQPLCERLFYICHQPDAKLLVNTDKPEYQPKQRINVSLKLNTPGIAHLSLAAVDALTVPVQPANILTYLNLQSEVRGNIEKPSRYFDSTNMDRSKQLDLLLLTQGWRNFIWKRLEDTSLKLTYEAEQGITITGRVRKVSSDNPLKDIHIMLQAPKAEGDKFFETTTDSAGKFVIYGPVFYGYQYLNLSSRNFDGKDKGKSDSGGQLIVDSLYRDLLPVNAVNNFVNDTLPSTDELLMKLKIPKKQLLKEVKIVASTNEFAPRMLAITQADQKAYGNIRQYLLNNIEGSQIKVIITKKQDVYSFLAAGGAYPVEIFPVYADGSKIDRILLRGQSILDMPMSQTIKITIRKRASLQGEIWSAEVALRPGALDTKDYFDNTTADMVGYYKAREFYKPKQEELDNNLDTRTNTIHWEPNITTDSKGMATISFNNTIQTGKVRLIVQGMTEKGEPLVATIGYEVK